ncbi:MAG: EamA family transporter [Proteobacteria bacterium]|nr:EamA family transporter [Pseudomonadota bacterium]
MEMVPTKIDRRLIASLAAVYVIWSSTYLAMRIVVHELPPLLTASMRFGLCGVIMIAFALRRGAKLPPLRAWLRVAPIGVLMFVGGNGFLAIAEVTVPSGGAAVVCATMPLWTGVLGALTSRTDRPTLREWGALVIGFVGVIVLMGGPSLTGDPAHIALTILSPFAWACGSTLLRRLPTSPDRGPLMLPAMQMITGAIALFVIAAIRGERLPTDASVGAWMALAYLLVFGSLVAFTAYTWLLRHARPIVATSYAYINPILAVLIAGVFYGEPLGVTTLIANILIVGAVILGMTRK